PVPVLVTATPSSVTDCRVSPAGNRSATFTLVAALGPLLTNCSVYVIAWPPGTAVAAAVLVTATSTSTRTSVVTDAVLPSAGSPTPPPLIVTVLVMLPATVAPMVA